MTITLRNTKGSALSFTELDDNFTHLDTVKISSSEKGASNGVASLDATGKVPSSQLAAYGILGGTNTWTGGNTFSTTIVNGTFSANGVSYFNDEVTFSEPIIISNGMTVSNPVVLNGTVAMGSTTTFNGSNVFNNTVVFNNPITVSGTALISGNTTLFNTTATAGSGIENGYVTALKSISAQDQTPMDIYFKSDGTKVYILGYTNKRVYQYTLSVAWDLSSATYTSSSPDMSSQSTSLWAMTFSADGTKMYTGSTTAPATIYRYDLSTAWDVTTATYTNSFNISAQETSPLGIHFKSDGTKMYIAGSAGDDITIYNLSSAWDITTASGPTTFSIVNQELGVHGLCFNSSGTKMWTSGDTGRINEWLISTPWDLTTATHNTYTDISYEKYTTTSLTILYPSGIYVNESVNKFWLCEYNTDNIIEFNIGQNNLKFTGNNLRFKYPIVNLEGNLSIYNNLKVHGEARITGNIYSSGTLYVSTHFAGSATSTCYLGYNVTSSGIYLGFSQSTGTANVGSATQTGAVNIGRSTDSQTVNIQSGVTASGKTSTINIGTAGASGSTTNINIGNSSSTCTTTINGGITLNSGRLTFPATQNASSDVNTLDDYEEGTHTPTVTASSGTFTTVSASMPYVKIGKQVTINYTVTITTNGTAAGEVRLTVPFNPSTTTASGGRETTAGAGCISHLSTTDNLLHILKYDNSYPGGSGYIIVGSLTYFV